MNKISPDLKKLIIGMLEPDENKRFSYKDIFENNWFNEEIIDISRRKIEFDCQKFYLKRHSNVENTDMSQFRPVRLKSP